MVFRGSVARIKLYQLKTLKPIKALNMQEPFNAPFHAKTVPALDRSMTDHELFVVHCTSDRNGWLEGDIWDDATNLILNVINYKPQTPKPRPKCPILSATWMPSTCSLQGIGKPGRGGGFGFHVGLHGSISLSLSRSLDLYISSSVSLSLEDRSLVYLGMFSHDCFSLGNYASEDGPALIDGFWTWYLMERYRGPCL